MSWEQWLADRAAEREAAGLRRTALPRQPDEATLDLAGNDYLGLSRHPEVTAAAARAAVTWGAGAGASRLVTGSTALHADLEAQLAAFTGQPSALVFSTGYHANLAVVAALADQDTLIVSDAHVHASLIDGCRLARTEVRVVGHHDVAAVRRELAAADGRRCLVLVESIYSVLGDAAPLPALAEEARLAGALLVVDEAHALGVGGAGGHGLVREHGLHRAPHVVVTATLSKALGAQGGAVLGSEAVREHLVNTARPFVYDTALAPASAAGALAALGHLRAHPALVETLHTRIAGLADGLGVARPAGAVVSVPMASPRAAVAAQQQALSAGVRVGCFRPPSTPDGVSRLRITVSAGIPEGDWQQAVGVVQRIVKEHS